MLTKSLPDKLIPGRDKRVQSWHSELVDWPVEQVALEVQVVADRRLSLFEWLALRILDEYGQDAPDLSAITDSFGFFDPVFLRDAIASLRDGDAIRVEQQHVPDTLAGVSLTPVGRQLVRGGGRAAFPERHGLQLCFDAIAGESMPALQSKWSDRPSHPVVAPAQLASRKTNVGLDRVREAARRQNELFLEQNARIQEATVRFEDGRHVWVKTAINWDIDEGGVLRPSVSGGGEPRQAWFQGNAFEVFPREYFRTVSTTEWANGRSHNRAEGMDHATWRKVLQKTIAPHQTVAEAIELVRLAQNEIVLHAGWLDAAELEKELRASTTRGVRCYVSGEPGGVMHWSNRGTLPPGFVAAAGDAQSTRSLAVISDQNRALCVDRVCLLTPAGDHIEAEIVSLATPDRASALRSELLDHFSTAWRGESEREQFVAFTLSPDLTRWHEMANRIRSEHAGPKQVEMLRHWADWASILGRTNANEQWLEPAVASWWQNFDATVDARAADMDDLIKVAAGMIEPSEVLERIADAPSDKSNPPALVLCHLVQWAAIIKKHWPGIDPFRQGPRFAQAVKACFDDDPDLYESLVAHAFATIQTDASTPEDAQRQALLLSSAVPQPHDAWTLLVWLEAQVPLQGIMGESLRRRAEAHLRRLAASRQAIMDLEPRFFDRLQRVCAVLGLAWPDKQPSRQLKRTYRNKSLQVKRRR